MASRYETTNRLMSTHTHNCRSLAAVSRGKNSKVCVLWADQWSEYGLSDPYWHWMGVSPSRLCRRLTRPRAARWPCSCGGGLFSTVPDEYPTPRLASPRRDDGSWALLVCGLGPYWTHSASWAGRGCRARSRVRVWYGLRSGHRPTACQNACMHAFVHAAVIVAQIPFRRNAWHARTIFYGCLLSKRLQLVECSACAHHV